MENEKYELANVEKDNYCEEESSTNQIVLNQQNSERELRERKLEVLNNVASNFQNIAALAISSRNEIARMDNEIEMYKLNATKDFADLQTKFDNIRPSVEKSEKEIDALLDQLKMLNVKTMNEQQSRIYQSLLNQLGEIRKSIMNLYEKLI